MWLRVWAEVSNPNVLWRYHPSEEISHENTDKGILQSASPLIPMMNGKTCVITGANSGIGKETAKALLGMGARVVMVCRDRERGEKARTGILKDAHDWEGESRALDQTNFVQARKVGSRVGTEVNGKIEDLLDLFFCDLSSQSSIRNLALELKVCYDSIDVLVNNAGLIMGRRTMTEDGLEWTLAVNHLAPFLLTHLLMEPLLKAPSARIITVSSEAHKLGRIKFDDLQSTRHYFDFKVYAHSKLANIFFTRELARKLSETHITANCLHPGVVRTRFGRSGSLLFRIGFSIVWPFMINTEKGARTSVYLASSPEISKVSGKYFKRMRQTKVSRAARNDDTAKRLWDVSSELVGLKDEELLESKIHSKC